MSSDGVVATQCKTATIDLGRLIATLWSNPVPSGCVPDMVEIPQGLTTFFARLDDDPAYNPPPDLIDSLMIDFANTLQTCGTYNASFTMPFLRNFEKGMRGILRYRNARDLTTEMGLNGFISYQIPDDCLKPIEDHYAEQLIEHHRTALTGEVKRPKLDMDITHPCFGPLAEWYPMAGVIDQISAYRGHSMTMVGAYTMFTSAKTDWWRALAERSMQWLHYDRHFTLLKTAIYLNDVTHEDQGPFRYVRGSNRYLPPALNEVSGKATADLDETPDFARLPDAIRYRSEALTGSSELFDQITTEEVVFYGPKGTSIAFDGANGLHRGGFTVGGMRTMMFVNFDIAD